MNTISDQERQIEEYVGIGAAAVAEREEKLGRDLSGTELKWLLRALFVNQYGEVLGATVATEVVGRLTRSSDDETGLRRR